MHETSIAQAVLDALEKSFPNGTPGRPRSIRLRAGVLVQVNPQALREAFALASEGSRWTGTVLEVTLEEPRVVCGSCGAEAAFPTAVCPRCKSTALNLRGGDELVVEEVTFDDTGQGETGP